MPTSGKDEENMQHILILFLDFLNQFLDFVLLRIIYFDI